jgi:hypothetical protein
MYQEAPILRRFQISGVAIPVLLFWIGERLFDGMVALIIWVLFTTFLLAYFPFGDQLKRWAIAFTIVFFWNLINGYAMPRINGVAGLEMLTIATLAVIVCLLLSVIPYPRMARSAARVELTSLTDAFVELLEPLSDAFCEPLKNGHFRKKVTSRTQHTFERLTKIERHLADAWYEPACFDPLLRGRLIMFAEHMRMCLRCLHILVNLRNQRAPHKTSTRFHNEWAVTTHTHTLLLHCCYTVVTLLLHYSYTVAGGRAGRLRHDENLERLCVRAIGGRRGAGCVH